jgi:hypothetical protein
MVAQRQIDAPDEAAVVKSQAMEGRSGAPRSWQLFENGRSIGAAIMDDRTDNARSGAAWRRLTAGGHGAEKAAITDDRIQSLDARS